MNIKKLYKQIAKKRNVSMAEVRREMAQAVASVLGKDVTRVTDDDIAQFIQSAAGEVKNKTN